MVSLIVGLYLAQLPALRSCIYLSFNSPDMQLVSLCQNPMWVIHNLCRTIAEEKMVITPCSRLQVSAHDFIHNAITRLMCGEGTGWWEGVSGVWGLLNFPGHRQKHKMWHLHLALSINHPLLFFMLHSWCAGHNKSRPSIPPDNDTGKPAWFTELF